MVWISRIRADSCHTSSFHRLTCDNRSPRRSRERGPTAPGAGHEEPGFPWSRADFRHHVLRLVREYVPRSWRSCTRSSTSAIQTRFGVTSTPAPRGGSLRSRGSRAPCTAPCVSGAGPRPCGPVGSGARASSEPARGVVARVAGAPAPVRAPVLDRDRDRGKASRSPRWMHRFRRCCSPPAPGTCRPCRW